MNIKTKPDGTKVACFWQEKGDIVPYGKGGLVLDKEAAPSGYVLDGDQIFGPYEDKDVLINYRGTVIATFGIDPLEGVPEIPKNDNFVFETSIVKTGQKVWQYCFTDSEGKNQHSGIYFSKDDAEKGLRQFNELWTDEDVKIAIDKSKNYDGVNSNGMVNWRYSLEEIFQSLQCPSYLELPAEEIEYTAENYKKYGERFGNPIYKLKADNGKD